MYTLCSHCHTAQEVTREMLVPTRGELDCGHCGRRFDALENLSRDPPPGRPLARRRAAPESLQPSLFAAPAAAPEPPATASSKPAAPASEAVNAATPEADSPRTDPIAEVLAAHADFIEPPSAAEPEALEASAGDAEPAVIGEDAPHAATQADGSDAADASDAPPSAEAPEFESRTEPEPIADAHADDAHDAGRPGAAITVPAPRQEVVLDLRDALDMALRAPAPSFLPGATIRPTHNRRRWPGRVAIAALLALLIAQSLVAERHVLAADARWRPWLERACSAFGCTLPVWHEPSTLHILTRDVRPHPSTPEALIISASFRNDARWAQPWPQLDLTLSDINGQAIARRRFAPAEYLGHLHEAPLIQPGQSASIALEVRDPGKQAVAFEFGFL